MIYTRKHENYRRNLFTNSWTSWICQGAVLRTQKVIWLNYFWPAGTSSSQPRLQVTNIILITVSLLRISLPRGSAKDGILFSMRAISLSQDNAT